MIKLENVYKRYKKDIGYSKWILQDINLTIPDAVSVGLIGSNGAGKSTLLRIIAGTDSPSRGIINRDCSISWPMGYGNGLQGSLSGKQNAKFVCRIHGCTDDMNEKLAFIREFAAIGEAFDQPVKTYSSGMKSRLIFAMSLAFKFDVYISDEVTSAGDRAFAEKARTAFRQLVTNSSLIMVSHSESTLREFCQAGILLSNGSATWFDRIDDALKEYQLRSAA